MPDPIEPPAPAIGAGEDAWREYAASLREMLATAERARYASRKAANRRSWLLNAVQRDLQAGKTRKALNRLEYRERAVYEARQP